MKHHSGSIEVVTGSMFSGKTDELIRRLRRATIARQKVQVFKPVIDNRYNVDKVTSHAGTVFGALILVAGPLASAFGEPDLENAVRAAAIALFFSAGFSPSGATYFTVS